MKNSTKNGSSEMMIESGSDFSLVYRQWFGHQLWPALCTSYVWALPSAYPLLVHQWRGGSHPGEVVSEIWVKSGEELSQLFTTRKRPVYRYFRRMGEEWRVFHESIVYSKSRNQKSQGDNLVLLSLMAGFTVLHGQPTGRYGDSWLF